MFLKKKKEVFFLILGVESPFFPPFLIFSLNPQNGRMFLFSSVSYNTHSLHCINLNVEIIFIQLCDHHSDQSQEHGQYPRSSLPTSCPPEGDHHSDLHEYG